jgi:formylglycine-generating enzyme required for sulfatase activity
METLLRPSLDRGRLIAWYRANRARSAELFGWIDPSVYYDAPIALRHPFVFYEGHIPGFSFNTLARNALRCPSIDRRLEDLFERGIDPSVSSNPATRRQIDWPSRDDVRAFAQACDDAVLDALANAKLDDPSIPDLVNAEAAYTILEHEPMHHETLLYIVHRLDARFKQIPKREHRDEPVAPSEPIAIGAGLATLGAERGAVPFGWDNEFQRHAVDVPAFGIDRYDVTNGEYLAFVDAGGPVPPFWVLTDDGWQLRVLAGTIPLPHSWPVYATQEQAAAFASWSGARLMTEAEYHRAAYGTPSGEERPQPWGDAAPSAAYGNFDFRRFDPEPVGSSPRGASAWGVHDLVGNGWEWTSTPFAPFDGFIPMASYKPYSADFFDGKHYVMKGASPVTSRDLVRRSFRNWFYTDYPYMYATFRRAYD